MKAADFTYVTVHGDNSRMSRLKAQYTMLFFYDPDCSNCRKFEKLFAEIPAFVEMVENGTLRVLAIYPDENREEWAAKAVYMPQGWIVGWNKQAISEPGNFTISALRRLSICLTGGNG